MKETVIGYIKFKMLFTCEKILGYKKLINNMNDIR